MLLSRYLSFIYNARKQALPYATWAVLGEGCSSACGREARALLAFGIHLHLLTHFRIHC